MLRDILNRNVVCVDPSTTIPEVARLMSDRDVGSVLVLEGDRPLGILTDRDIVIRCLTRETRIDACRVEDVMTESIESCRETDGIFDCIRKMRNAKVRRMPVVDSSGKPVGIISFGDLLAVLSKELGELTATTTPAEELEQISDSAA